jgi:rubrerythrin
MPAERQCLPIDEVLKTVQRVESDAVRFYELAAKRTTDEEALRLFDRLRTEMKAGADSFARVCESLACGSAALAPASPHDVDFLSVLAESAFFGRTLRPDDMAAPGLGLENMVANGLHLERDLLLFYMKFFGVSCAEHRPVFSELISRGQKHISELNNLSRRLRLRPR